MKRLFLAFLLKYNGALAGMCVFAIVVGASFHVMHGKFDQQAKCQALLQDQLTEQAKAVEPGELQQAKPTIDQCSNRRQMQSFSFYDLFFSRHKDT